ncbi:class I SAM-dependent methyltransferase [Diaminobutyricibacter sp. McL0608]|uniref:class I SAM-dependent methyltransferase n=1 Tax=Leifsonia sp. McL0608 TaxID=3143537 RepID=UPI0031F2F766
MTQTGAPDTWERGDGYERYIGRWSSLVARVFLEWLELPPGLRWLDVGSGTGALTAEILDRCAPASVVGVEPSEAFVADAMRRLGGRVELHRAGADAIPLPDASVDVTVSGLVLNFVPDARAAVAEARRVTRVGGTIAAYVWDYVGHMELMRYFWGAALELDPAAPDEGARFPISDPGRLEELFAGAGLTGPHARSIDVPTTFADFDDYWQPFLGGQGPAPTYVASLDESARGRLRDRIRERLPIEADGSIALVARAWAVRASVAA